MHGEKIHAYDMHIIKRFRLYRPLAVAFQENCEAPFDMFSSSHLPSTLKYNGI